MHQHTLAAGRTLYIMWQLRRRRRRSCHSLNGRHGDDDDEREALATAAVDADSVRCCERDTQPVGELSSGDSLRLFRPQYRRTPQIARILYNRKFQFAVAEIGVNSRCRPNHSDNCSSCCRGKSDLDLPEITVCDLHQNGLSLLLAIIITSPVSIFISAYISD